MYIKRDRGKVANVHKVQIGKITLVFPVWLAQAAATGSPAS
jgi:hypothetical protein